jgi:hypothetical protein
METIQISRDFSDFPAGRYKTDGDFSGEWFREKLLVPPLKNHREVTVILDQIKGRSYPTSFLDEAFGGLVRSKEFTVSDLEKSLKIKA